MDWHVAVITAPRETQTLDVTLESLAQAGWSDATIYSDRAKRGPYWNWRRAVDETYAKFPRVDGSRFLIAEDDAEFTPGIREYLDNMPMLDGIVSLYTAAPNHKDVGGWHEVSTQKPIRTYGSLALVIPTYLLMTLARYPMRPDWMDKTDHAVGLWCRKHGVPYWCHSPSFVRHIGTTSTVQESVNDHCRQCKVFATVAPVAPKPKGRRQRGA